MATTHDVAVARNAIDAREDAGQRIRAMAIRLGMYANSWLMADIGFGLRASSSGVSRAKPAYAMVDGMLIEKSGRMKANNGTLLAFATMKMAVAIWNPAYARVMFRNSECGAFISCMPRQDGFVISGGPSQATT